MKRRIWGSGGLGVWGIALMLVVCILACSFKLFSSETRKLGNPNTPERIISLKPNITEILFALGVGDKVVGVTTWCDHPEEAKKLPKVADYININTEKITALQPDLVIGSEENSLKEPFKVLENAGIKALFVPFRTMNDLYSSIEKIAEAVGVSKVGENLVKLIKAEMNTPPHHGPLPQGERGRGEGNLHTPRILMLVGHRPLVAAGPVTFLGDIIKLAGAKNIIDSEKTPYPTINTEFILAKDPDIIIDLGMGSETANELPEMLKGRVIKFNMSDFRAGPNIGEAIKKLNETSHSKTFSNNQ